jgi:hypothetical protein
MHYLLSLLGLSLLLPAASSPASLDEGVAARPCKPSTLGNAFKVNGDADSAFGGYSGRGLRPRGPPLGPNLSIIL